MYPLDQRLNLSWWLLRIGFGVAPLLAGLDKFFNVLTDWEMYLNPLVLSFVPVSGTTFMHAVGIIEMLAGATVLTRWTRLAGYVVAAWLLGIAVNLITIGSFFDVAVRDVLLAIGAYTLAQLSSLREEAESIETSTAPGQPTPARTVHTKAA